MLLWVTTLLIIFISGLKNVLENWPGWNVNVIGLILYWVLTLFHPFVFEYDDELKQKSEPWHVSRRAKLTRFILCINFVKFIRLTLQGSRCFRQGSDTFCAEESEWTYKRTITSSQYPLFLTWFTRSKCHMIMDVQCTCSISMQLKGDRNLTSGVTHFFILILKL